jgi:arylsulfatase A-like enzyme
MKQRPNILVVMSDDHASWASGVAGCAAARTPGMDWLAATGCRFTGACTPSPVCSPARACFFTGLIPSAHGIHDWIEERDCWNTDWLAGCPTLPQQLQAAGYETALVGKWHCGRSHTPQPGFDAWFSYARAHQYPHFGDQHFITKSGFVSGVGRQSRFLLDHARAWLRARSSERPFFLFYGPVDTHSPFAGHAPPLVEAMRRADFSDIPFEAERYPPERRVLAFPGTVEERREHLAQYLAAVASLDEQLRTLIDTLAELGQLEDTLVLYTSDHGHMNGHHGLVGKGNGSIPQNFHDEAIQVPCFARWPGRIAAGSVVSAPVDHCDWFVTLLEIGGARLADIGERSPGRSLTTLLDGRAADWRADQVCEYGNARMIRNADSKLIVRNLVANRRYPDEFYDLSQDPRETRNVIDEPGCAATVACLRERLARYFERWETPANSGWDVSRLPRFNPEEAWHADARLFAAPSSSIAART